MTSPVNSETNSAIVQSDAIRSDMSQESASPQVSDNILTNPEHPNPQPPPPQITTTIIDSETEMIPNVRQLIPPLSEPSRPQISQPTTSTSSESPEIVGPLRFETLPDKILVRILKMIPREDLDELKSVSSQFRILIDGQIGLSVCIGSEDLHLAVVDRVDVSIAKLKENGVSSCTVLNLINTNVPERPYKHPNLLRSLTVYGYISEKNFIRLISTTSNVEKLIIDLSTMTTVEFQDINVKEIFPKLTHLKITYDDFRIQWYETQWITCIFSLIGLLGQRYPNLKEFSVGIPYINKCIVNSITAYNFQDVLTKFILQHGNSLKRLAVDYNGLDNDIEEDDAPNTNNAIAAQPIILGRLEQVSLSLDLEDVGEDSPRHPVALIRNIQQQWSPILNAQRKLQKCTVTHSIFLSPEIAANVCRNNQLTLKVLHWKFRKQDGEGERVEIDCIIFQDCVNLEEIVLSGPSEEDIQVLRNDQALWTRPKFYNLSNLPQNLEKIKLDFCEVTSVEFPVIATAFPRLEYLSLDTSCDDPNGLSVETLAALLDKESLKLLIVLKSFNNRTEATSENPGSNSLLSAWRITTPLSATSSFDLRKNTRGEWENAGTTFAN